MRMRLRLLRMVALLAAMTLVLAACGDGDGDGDGGDDGTGADDQTTDDSGDTDTTDDAADSGDGDGGEASADGEPASGPRNIIRFTFAPDPVWDYLQDSGIKDEMEQESGITILAAPTWNEFGIYAGGHSDIVSVGSFEVPLLEIESGRKAVVFGKYNKTRAVIAAPADSPADSICDIPPGSDIAIYDTVGPALLWGVIFERACGLDYRADGGDFNLTLADITNTAQLALDHEVAAAQILPDFSIPQLMSGDVKILDDGKTAPEWIAEFVGGEYEGPMTNIFLAGEEWYDEHPEEVAFFAEMWQRGLDEWQANKDAIIESYPQHFAAETPEQIDFIKDYLAENDWFATDFYLTDEWIEKESRLFDLMRESGFMGEDEVNPRFEVLTP